MSPKPINTAIVGIGMSAQIFHAPFLLALPDTFKLHTIVERKATSDFSLARERLGHTGVKIVSSLDTVLADPDVDLVIVTTFPETHASMAKAILSAGKHVIVEKPLVPTSAEAQELVDLAHGKGLVLATFQNRRWDSDFLTVKALLAKGAFGDLSEFDSHFDRYKNVLNTGARSWKDAPSPGTGHEFDLGAHLVDQAVDLFGKPESVQAVIRNARGIGHEDVADHFQIRLSYPPAPSTPGRALPLLVTLQASMLSLQTPQVRFVVRGTSATFVKHGVDVQESQLVKGGTYGPTGKPEEGAVKVGDEAFGVEGKELEGTLYTAKGEEKVETAQGSYISWFQNVADAIRAADPTRLVVTPAQAKLTIELIEAARLSAKEGRTVRL